MYVCIYVRVYICAYVYMYVCIYVCVYICTYVYMYVCIYVRVYVHTYVCESLILWCPSEHVLVGPLQHGRPLLAD